MSYHSPPDYLIMPTAGIRQQHQDALQIWLYEPFTRFNIFLRSANETRIGKMEKWESNPANGLPINRLLFEPLYQKTTFVALPLSYLSLVVCLIICSHLFFILKKKMRTLLSLYLHCIRNKWLWQLSPRNHIFLCMRPNPHASGFSLYNTSENPQYSPIPISYFGPLS